jgi:hypothetical protein
VTPRLSVVMLSLLVVGLFAGCGSGSDPAPTTAAEPAPEAVESEPASYAPQFKPHVWIESRERESDGSTARQRLEIGHLVPAEDFTAPDGFAGLEYACDVNQQRDALIPARLTAQNTTANFPLPEFLSALRFINPVNTETIAGGVRKGLETSVAQSFSEGETSCEAAEEMELSPVHFDLAAGESGHHHLLFIVHNYYSPNYPEGNAEGLAPLRIGIFPYRELRCLSASTELDGEYIPLDGGPITEHLGGEAEAPSC